MDSWIQYISWIDPLATEDDVLEIKRVNVSDLLITFKDGKKYLIDIFTKYHKEIFYDDINELTEEQEKREFAYMLRTIMNHRRITQEELAERSNTSQTMISHYMTGRCIPNAIKLNKIAKVLKCSMDDFFNKNY